MKAILLSIKPQYCELIASGKKTIEVRKTRPKLDTPFKCYIYCTKGKVDKCANTKNEFENRDNCRLLKESCLSLVARLEERSYEDKSGNKRKATEFTVSEIEAMEPSQRTPSKQPHRTITQALSTLKTKLCRFNKKVSGGMNYE